MAGVKTAVRRVAKAVDRLRPPPDGVTILIYHRVGGHTPTSVDLPTAQFADQIDYLAEHCRVVTLDTAADLLSADPADLVDADVPADDPSAGDVPANGAPSDGAASSADDRPIVALTFDDGTADFVDEALPVLDRHRVPVTYYLATDFIERQLPFPNDGLPMTWAAAAEAVASGLVAVGSHTDTHALLDRIPAIDAAAELDRSIERIRERLDVDPHHFAYPKAVLGSPAAQAEVRARFRTATIARTRPNPFGTTDLHQLTRSPVQTTDDLDVFARKAAGGMGFENDVRDLLNRWRYRGATS